MAYDKKQIESGDLLIPYLNDREDAIETLASDLIGGVNANITSIAEVATDVTAGPAGNILDIYKGMKDASIRLAWQYLSNTADGWPIAYEGFNFVIIFRGTQAYGSAIAIMGNGKTYTAILRNDYTAITWAALN